MSDTVLELWRNMLYLDCGTIGCLRFAVGQARVIKAFQGLAQQSDITDCDD